VSAPLSRWVFDVQEADFEREVIERSKERPVVVDFWAPWCAPCRMLGPVLEHQVEQRDGEILLAKVNLDHAPNLAARYNIQHIPLVIAFRDGRPVLDFEGLLPEPQLALFLDQLLPTDADRLARQASALEKTNPAQAEALYQKALEADRNHDPARLGLVRLLMERGEDDRAGELLAEVGTVGETGAEAEKLSGLLFLRKLARPFGDEAARKRVEAEPKNAAARYELGCVLAAAGKYEEALEQLLAAGERDSKLAANQVREAMVKIFHILGPQSPLAADYRGRLTTLLY
jgi:putative thioredoxin